MKQNQLKGRIVAMYGTIRNFADKLGWSPRKVSYIVNGLQEPNASDIEHMAKALEVEIPTDLHALFFT